MRQQAKEINVREILASIPFEVLQNEFKRRRRVVILEREIARKTDRIKQLNMDIEEANAEVYALNTVGDKT